MSCANDEKVRVAFALDDCDREVMSWVASTNGIISGPGKDLMMQAIEYRFAAGNAAQFIPPLKR